jgi:kumamolisin
MARRAQKRAPRKTRRSSGDASSPPDDRLTLTVYLRHRQKVRRRPGSGIDLTELTRRVTRDELEAERRRILKRPVERVRRFAGRERMKVVDVDFLRRTVRLSAKARDVERAFETKLAWSDEGSARCHFPAREPKIPRPLAAIAHAVVGMDTRPARLSRLESHGDPGVGAALFPSRIAGLYGIATAGRGAGQCIAIIEPAGGYDREDVAAACKAMNVPAPDIQEIMVGKGSNVMGANAKADKEVALDVQVVAGIAPEARIAVYFTELNEPGLVAGVAEAVHGPHARPNVIVITWGEPEELWPKDSRRALDAVLQDAARLGITVVTSAGDDLATERMNDAKVHVNYPAASPYVLGCGGTRITLDAAGNAITQEVVWNETGRGTGGGISTFYQVPDFQAGAKLPASLNDGKRGRGVPDVAATAAQTNGYRIVLRGAEIVNGGTSAVAPLWGAFIALLNEQRGKPLGYVNQRLYDAPQLFKPITSGNNIDAESGLGYEAGPGPGWNACTGLGVPIGAAIVAALSAVA